MSGKSNVSLLILHVEKSKFLYHATENTANQNTGKPLFDGITSTLPIMCRAYVSLIVLATLFSMSWYKIVIQRSLVVYYRMSHLSLGIFLVETLT